MLHRLAYLLAVMVLWLPSQAQNRIDSRQREIDSIANPPLDRNEALAFDADLLEVGTLCEDDVPQTYRFTFSNAGKKPLVITKVTSSCGCATPSFTREPIAPGNRAEIAVRFNPKGHPGILNRHVYVYTNSSAVHPSVRLTLRGTVAPTKDQWQGYRVIMGPSLRAKRNQIAFKNLSPAESRTERIECVNTGSEPLRLTIAPERLPGHIVFRTEPEIIPPGTTADLIVTVDGRRRTKPDQMSEKWTLPLDGIEASATGYNLILEIEFTN